MKQLLQPFLHHKNVTLSAPVQMWSNSDGQIIHLDTGANYGEEINGVYFGDTRMFSHYEFLLSGDGETYVRPDHVLTRQTRVDAIEFDYVFRGIEAEIVDPLVTVTRRVETGRFGLKEFITWSSAAGRLEHLWIRVVLATDMVTMENVKSSIPGGVLAPLLDTDGNATTVRWRREDVQSSITGAGAECELHGNEYAGKASRATLTWKRPAGQVLEWEASFIDERLPVRGPAGHMDSWPAITGRALGEKDPRLPQFLKQAAGDLDQLRMEHRDVPGSEFVAAGAPWFLTLFGRDSLLSATMLRNQAPSLALGTLEVLAALQGTEEDQERVEQPGKILHEVRKDGIHIPGENEGTGLHLPPLYYGTLDATPLWLMLFNSMWSDHGLDSPSRARLERLVPAALAAARWIVDYGDADGDGLLEYFDPTGTGLANQGWKDSGDSIRFHDGRQATGPIALCEVQGYAYQGLTGFLDLARLRDGDLAADMEAFAERLRAEFHAKFWVERDGLRYPALALDRDKEKVDGLSSNIGHLLGTGLLDAEQEEGVSALLVDPVMFTGFGIRTLSADNGGYWPLSYHCGSVWPHDTGYIASRMAASGHDGQARAVARAVLHAAQSFDYRLPELFAGDSVDRYAAPRPYPASCRPQGWSAAAAAVVCEILG